MSPLRHSFRTSWNSVGWLGRLLQTPIMVIMIWRLFLLRSLWGTASVCAVCAQWWFQAHIEHYIRILHGPNMQTSIVHWLPFINWIDSMSGGILDPFYLTNVVYNTNTDSVSSPNCIKSRIDERSHWICFTFLFFRIRFLSRVDWLILFNFFCHCFRGITWVFSPTTFVRRQLHFLAEFFASQFYTFDVVIDCNCIIQWFSFPCKSLSYFHCSLVSLTSKMPLKKSSVWFFTALLNIWNKVVQSSFRFQVKSSI